MDARTDGDIFLYYQWDNGGLRYISQSPGRVWQGSTDLDVPDAKLRTPLASVSYVESTIWWLFYVDNSNIIQSIYSEKDPSMWRKGSVGNKGYKVPNSTNIAFTGSRGRKYNETLNDLDGGLSLYASAIDGTIQEYIFNNQDGSWTEGFNFPGANGLAGASTWSVDSKAFIYTPHDLMRNGSICGQYGIAFQGSNGTIQGSNFSTFQDLKQVLWDTLYDISEQPAMDGSAISCWYFFPAKNAKRNVMFQVFYQTTGKRITEAVRLWGPDNSTVPGTWIYNDVPI
ncbi:MAG: hypothetical protein Q9228_006187 [Teloschistes exilis]